MAVLSSFYTKLAGGRMMTGVRKITKQTNNRFANMYELEAETRDGFVFNYYMA